MAYLLTTGTRSDIMTTYVRPCRGLLFLPQTFRLFAASCGGGNNLKELTSFCCLLCFDEQDRAVMFR
jgi:hypothetical protein